MYLWSHNHGWCFLMSYARVALPFEFNIILYICTCILCIYRELQCMYFCVKHKTIFCANTLLYTVCICIIPILILHTVYIHWRFSYMIHLLYAFFIVATMKNPSKRKTVLGMWKNLLIDNKCWIIASLILYNVQSRQKYSYDVLTNREL
jgi:hypothetical protein